MSYSFRKKEKSSFDFAEPTFQDAGPYYPQNQYQQNYQYQSPQNNFYSGYQYYDQYGGQNYSQNVQYSPYHQDYNYSQFSEQPYQSYQNINQNYDQSEQLRKKKQYVPKQNTFCQQDKIPEKMGQKLSKMAVNKNIFDEYNDYDYQYYDNYQNTSTTSSESSFYDQFSFESSDESYCSSHSDWSKSSKKKRGNYRAHRGSKKKKKSMMEEVSNEFNFGYGQEQVDKVICPFNTQHIMLEDRLLTHIDKCKLSECARGYVNCRYDPCHYFTFDKIEAHELVCDKRKDRQAGFAWSSAKNERQISNGMKPKQNLYSKPKDNLEFSFSDSFGSSISTISNQPENTFTEQKPIENEIKVKIAPRYRDPKKQMYEDYLVTDF